MFLFREALGRDPGDLGGYEVSRRGGRVPTVLSRPECQRRFAALEGTTQLMVGLMYGSGMRLTELLRLRIKDVMARKHGAWEPRTSVNDEKPLGLV